LLKPLIWGSEGWGIDAHGDYLFATFYKYVLRYDIKKNQIDKIIDLGEAPDHWYYSATFSPDGQSCVAQAHEFDGPGQTGRVLIDLKKETAAPTEREHFPTLLGSPYQANDFVKVKVLNAYENGTAVAITMDENRIGAILPTEAGWDALGYYKFAVIDLAKDKIMQECPMNLLGPGETLSLYPTEPETEPLLIDYHLQSDTVMQARFPTDGRSSYDGFDIVKVVDAPADVAGFEECLKQSAWNTVEAGGWLKYNPASPNSYVLLLYGEGGRGGIMHLYDGPESEHPQGGAASLALYDKMTISPDNYQPFTASQPGFERYWVSWDVYKILYGLAA
jgi:hypothetical protein